MIIYSITNTTNGKIYIGCTTNKNRRWRRHQTELTNQYHDNEHLQRAWNKDGHNAFVFAIVETCNSHDEMWERECFWISHYQSHLSEKGYNLSLGGKGSTITSAGLARIIKANKGRPLTEEHKRRIGLANKGKPINWEARRRASETLRRRYAEGSLVPAVFPRKLGPLNPKWGTHHTQATKAKIKAARIRMGKTYEEMYGKEKAEQMVATLKIYNRKGIASHLYKKFDVNLLKKQLDQKLPLRHIMVQLGISRNTALAHFKQAYGITIKEYKKNLIKT